MPKSKVLICPYCGETQPAGDECRVCGGRFDALSRQASHNEMGPWFVRDERRSFQPGCSYETLVRLVEKQAVTKYSIVRGPTTRQFWTVAKRVPGIAHLLGYCHQCDAGVDSDVHGCPECGAAFGAYLDRDYLGLPEVRPMPWEADIEPGAGGRLAARRPQLNGGNRMSSFASDEELLGGGGPAMAAPPPPAHEVSVPSDSPPAAAAAGDDDSLAGTATRALQRALERQRRTVRLLSGLLAVTAISMLVLLAAVFRGGSDEPTPTDPPADRSVTPAATGEPGDDRSTGPLGGEPAEPPPVEVPVEVPDQAAAETTADAGDPWRKAIDDAAALARRAADGSIEPDRRIKALEEAIALLKGVEADAPADLGVTDLRERLERDLERLRLAEFFPDGRG